MAIEIELDAYVLPSNHTVWKSTAGKTHRFYRAVKNANTVFPDVRGLDALEGDPADWTDGQLLEAIAKDRTARDQTAEEGQGPVGDVAIVSQDRKTLTFLKRLWFEAKLGDLFIVPPDGWRESILIGQVLSEPGDIRQVQAADGEYEGQFYGRPVAWLAEIAKQDITADLLKVVHTRTAVFAVPESVKEEIYRFAYGNFVYRNRYVSEFRTTKEKFTTEDSVAISVWLNALDVLRNALANGDERAGESFAELGLSQLPEDLAAEMKIHIQSPGEIFVRTVGPFALSLMAMFTLSACDAETVDKDQVTVTLKQVGAGDPDATAAVEGDVNALKTALGQGRIEGGNVFVRRAREGGQITAAASLKNPPVGAN